MGDDPKSRNNSMVGDGKGFGIYGMVYCVNPVVDSQ